MTDKTDIAALLGKLKFFAGEASCHPDPNYSLEFERLCTPSNILAVLDQIEVVSKSEWKLAGELVELQMTFNALQKKDNSCTLGVGEGSGRLFVHGDYDSIKATQKIILERDALKAKLANPVVLPEDLHPQTAKLVINFASALAEKLHKAEQKYGYSDTWMQPHWQIKCLDDFKHHVSKGDPRDVAAYCAFMWYHGWSTAFKGE